MDSALSSSIHGSPLSSDELTRWKSFSFGDGTFTNEWRRLVQILFEYDDCRSAEHPRNQEYLFMQSWDNMFIGEACIAMFTIMFYISKHVKEDGRLHPLKIPNGK